MNIIESAFTSRQMLHTTVYAQEFSPCGKYLVAATNLGQLVIFSIPAALSPGVTESGLHPYFSFPACSGAIYTLTSNEKFLIAAGTDTIVAFNWTDIILKTPKIVWSLSLPVNLLDRFSSPEINKILLKRNADDTQLFCGCGDNCVHVWDLESGKLIRSLRGHTNYVHDLALKNSADECVSASEDGSVKIWDLRIGGEAVQTIEPYKTSSCARPQFGKWVGCVAVDPADDWLICGGAPKLTMWHLRSLSSTTVFETPSACQQFVTFYEDTIISAGSESYVNHWFVNGDLKFHTPCVPTSVFSVAINSKSEAYKVLTVGGSSSEIDVCTNFGYKAFSLSVC